jgi:hypothetical protein
MAQQRCRYETVIPRDEFKCHQHHNGYDVLHVCRKCVNSPLAPKGPEDFFEVRLAVKLSFQVT